MSQTKFPVIRIRSKNAESAPTGANTIVELDGQPLPMVSFIKVECHARRMTKVMIEMYAHVEIDTMGELTTEIVELVPKKK